MPKLPRRNKKQLHCSNCGKLRNMKLMLELPYRNEDGTVDMVTAEVNVSKAKSLYKEHKNETLPTNFFAQCPVCYNFTTYNVNADRKLVANAL